MVELKFSWYTEMSIREPLKHLCCIIRDINEKRKGRRKEKRLGKGEEKKKLGIIK